ncbi:MAG: rhamnulokinase [Oscillospiraceae bacterium]|jgi:rhamnulokinase/L-fuculokinase|nr:rhamnulokinase [Oscillospiraceae bacterium]
MNKSTHDCVAIDFGASSGRVMLGRFDGASIQLEELHRFSNDPVMVSGTLHWDVLRLLHEIKQGLAKAAQSGADVRSIGVDTWGVDFALLDERGQMLQNPVHYRDARNTGAVASAAKHYPLQDFYAETGIQFMDWNTAFQLHAIRQAQPELLERADRLLFLPDLFGYFLTGQMTTEYSIAGTSQLLSLSTGDWSEIVMEKLKLPKRLFGKIVPSGTYLGALLPEIQRETGLGSVPVVSVCGHDTQSARAAVPSKTPRFAFLSSGSWSLLGTETDKPIADERSFARNITNEAGFGGTFGFLKNINGLFFIQESRRYFNRDGAQYGYADLERLATEVPRNLALIDPNDPLFVAPGDIPVRVQQYCSNTNQPVPQSIGEIIRCIYESLAQKYKDVLLDLQTCTGKTYDRLHVIGGGAKDGYLCQLTANACGIDVMAGPVEATVLGNLCVQLIQAGKLESIAAAREMLAQGDIKTYRSR